MYIYIYTYVTFNKQNAGDCFSPALPQCEQQQHTRFQLKKIGMDSQPSRMQQLWIRSSNNWVFIRQIGSECSEKRQEWGFRDEAKLVYGDRGDGGSIHTDENCATHDLQFHL